MIALVIGAVPIFLLVVAWLVGPYVREALADRRQMRIREAQIQAEQTIRAATQATLAAMREAARQHLRGQR